VLPQALIKGVKRRIREYDETIPDHGFAVETEKKMADST